MLTASEAGLFKIAFYQLVGWTLLFFSGPALVFLSSFLPSSGIHGSGEMGRPPSFLPKPDVSLHWAPQSYISPCFHHVGHDDAVVGCLTGAVKALHENRLALDALQRKADADKKDWDRRKQELVRF